MAASPRSRGTGSLRRPNPAGPRTAASAGPGPSEEGARPAGPTLPEAVQAAAAAASSSTAAVAAAGTAGSVDPQTSRRAVASW